MKTRKIAVLGDVCVDVLEVSKPPAESASGELVSNWRMYPETYQYRQPGGALLLAQFVQAASGCEVVGMQPVNVNAPKRRRILESHLKLEYLPKEHGSQETALRLGRYTGFSGSESAQLLPCVESGRGISLIVFDDPGNGFRDEPSAWEPVFRGLRKGTPIVLNMCRPLMTGKLWKFLVAKHQQSLLLVLSANDLREIGVQLSRRLSWERTAKDFVWHLENNAALAPLRSCAHVVVRFGCDAAIYTRNGPGRLASSLCFDPVSVEDGFAAAIDGNMPGLTYAFLASITATVSDVKPEARFQGLLAGIHAGIRSARALLKAGFVDSHRGPAHPVPEIFRASDDPSTRLACVTVPNPDPKTPKESDPKYWRILDALSSSRIEDMALRVVREGPEKSLAELPLAQFNRLRTVDRAEIEGYRAIQNLMREYLFRENTKRPLCIAVFGAPGSGKSFGVKEIAASVAPDAVEEIEFNVSQFSSPRDLIHAFHKVRDIVLHGKVPLVFFDEFDSAYEGKLGWLKYFLAPMQDGTFRDGETIHPIGKSIFVFAGGTKDSYGSFAADANQSPEPDSKGRKTAGNRPRAAQLRGVEFRDAKGTDFLSRLRGFVDVLGPNPVDKNDRFHIIRRAIFLRSIIERNAKTLLDSFGRARIASGVIWAMLKTPRYKHGVRSIEAIVEMSVLSGARFFDQAALPPVSQLALHVDAKFFERLMIQETSFAAVREPLAQTIHECFVQMEQGKRPKSDPAMQPWKILLDTYKEANRRQADHIPIKLRAIGCGMMPASGRRKASFRFSKKEVELMAELEHERWVVERVEAGYTPGPRDPEKKTSPYLGPWDSLQDSVKQYDRNTVRAIPELLASVGFEVYRLE